MIVTHNVPSTNRTFSLLNIKPKGLKHVNDQRVFYRLGHWNHHFGPKLLVSHRVAKWRLASLLSIMRAEKCQLNP